MTSGIDLHKHRIDETSAPIHPTIWKFPEIHQLNIVNRPGGSDFK